MPGDPAVQIVPFTAAHLPEVVKLHKYCFRPEDNVSMRLGDAFLYKTYRFFLEDPVSFGYVAFVEERMAGFIMGRMDYYVDALNKYRKKTLITSLITHPGFLFDKEFTGRVRAVISRLINPAKTAQAPSLADAPSHVQGKTATLASIAVDPTFTKLKVSDMLVEASIQATRNAGMLILRSGIARSNMSSRFIFSKKGFVEDKVLSQGEGMFYFKKL